MPDVFAGMPCNDADVAREGVGDYAILAPRCEVLTDGTDGAIAGASWDLTSASNDFAAQGIQPGHVVVLDTRVEAGKKVPMGKVMLGVTAAAGSALTLHRLGYGSGGRTPGGAADYTGITFAVPSVLVHIQTAAVEVRRMLGIAAATDLSTLPDINRLAALLTLRALYFAEYRQTTQDTWRDKMAMLDAVIDRELKSLRDLFPSGDPDGLAVTFGTIDLGISRRRWCPEF